MPTGVNQCNTGSVLPAGHKYRLPPLPGAFTDGLTVCVCAVLKQVVRDHQLSRHTGKTAAHTNSAVAAAGSSLPIVFGRSLRMKAGGRENHLVNLAVYNIAAVLRLLLCQISAVRRTNNRPALTCI